MTYNCEVSYYLSQLIVIAIDVLTYFLFRSARRKCSNTYTSIDSKTGC